MKNVPIFYVTTDPLRALGIEDYYDNFHIICVDYTDVVDMLIKKGVSLFCIEKERGRSVIVRNSRKLLLHEDVQTFILERSTNDVGIIFFKPLFSLETVIADTRLGKQRNLRSLNAPPSVSSLLENKLNFITICSKNNVPHPPSRIEHLNSLRFSALARIFGERMVVQFERGWFGNRTFFVTNEGELNILKSQYSNRKVKISRFIPGTTLTVNAVVSDKTVFQTYPFIQINDDVSQDVLLARMPGSTVGNIWTDLDTYFEKKTEDVVKDINRIVVNLGGIIRDLGYRGFFGVDFLVDKHARVYAQEINPRFTASVQMISQLEDNVCGSSLLKEHYVSFGVEIGDVFASDRNTYTKRLQGTRVISRNTQPTHVVVNHTPPNGIYMVGEQGIEFIEPTYTIDSLSNNKFLLLSIGDGRSVSSNEQLFEIQSLKMFPKQVLSYARTIKEKQF